MSKTATSAILPRPAWRVTLLELFAYTAAVGLLCSLAMGNGHRDERAVAVAFGGSWLLAYAVQQARGQCGVLLGTAAGAIAAAVTAFFRNETPLAIAWVAALATIAGLTLGGLLKTSGAAKRFAEHFRKRIVLSPRPVLLGLSISAIAIVAIAFCSSSLKHASWPECRVYDLRSDLPGFQARGRAYVRVLERGDRRPRAIGGFVLSHDGSRLALEDPRNGLLRLFDLQRGRWIPLRRQVPGRPLDFSPDRSLLAVYRRGAQGGDVAIVELSSMREVAQTPYPVGRRLYGRAAAYFAFEREDAAEHANQNDRLAMASWDGQEFSIDQLDANTGERSTLAAIRTTDRGELAAATYDGRWVLLNESDSRGVSLWNSLSGKCLAQLPPAKYLDQGKEVDWRGSEQVVSFQDDLLLHRHSLWDLQRRTSIAFEGRALGFTGKRRFVVAAPAKDRFGQWLNRCRQRVERMKRLHDLPFTAPRAVPEPFAIAVYDADRPGSPLFASRSVNFVWCSDRYDGRVDQWTISGDGRTVAAIDALDRLFVWRLPPQTQGASSFK